MRADAQEKRNAIVTASVELFATEGFEVPFRTIANAAGVGVATVHRHFPDRVDLVLAVAHRFWDRMEGIIHSYDDLWDTNAEAALYNIVRELSDLHPLSFMAMGETIINNTELLPADNSGLQRALSVSESFANKAKEHKLIDASVLPAHFFLGIAVISRQIPQRVEGLFPDYLEFLIKTYLAGLRPEN